jgi:Protein of unknown function (DUF3822)
MADSPPSKRYQVLLAAKDKSFDAAILSQYHLSIYVSDTCLKISCVNPTTTQCLLLEAYKLSYGHSYQRIQAIEQLYQDRPLLVARDWSTVTLCISNQQYTLIPKEFFQEKNLADYLSFICPVDSAVIRHFTHSHLDMAVAFAIDPWLFNWFKATYDQPQLHTIHQASSLIQGTWAYLRDNKQGLLPSVLVFVEANHLHITVMQKSQLLYYNKFEYTNSDELLYYILIVMRTLQLDTSLHEVMLGGAITKSTPAYSKARNYIRKLTLVSTPPYLKFRSVFTKEMRHAHLDVLSTHLCQHTV